MLVDGLPVKSCLMLTIEAVGRQITTVEGLKNTPEQQAFIDLFAFQCGYCTSGFLMVCHALKTQHPNATDSEIDDWLPEQYLPLYELRGNRQGHPRYFKHGDITDVLNKTRRR